MPKKRPPNAEATQFRAGEQQVEIARQGGIASGVSRRGNKTVQKTLCNFLGLEVTKIKTLEALATKAGLPTDVSVKDLFVVVCVLNTLKKGDISELEKLAKLLGEQTEVADTEAQKQAALLDALKKAITDAD